MDLCFTCCAKSIDYYKMSGCKDSHYIPPGYDTSVHKIDVNNEFREEYECDLSIVCTNLYDFNDGLHINRRTMLDEIVRHKDIKFYIYGSKNLEKIYPDNYRGFIDFNDTYKVFYHSKINLNTHIRKNGNMYVNERTNQILGSKGLLYIDEITGLDTLFNRHTECVVIDENNYVEQIKGILENYELYEKVKENGYAKAKKHFTWDIFASNINQYIFDYIIRKNIKLNNCIVEAANNDSILAKELSVSKDNLLEIYDLLCSIYYSNYSIQNKLNILDTLIKKYDIDINLFLEMNIDKVIRQRLRTILL